MSIKSGSLVFFISLGIATLLCLASCSQKSGKETGRKPNVILIITDDQGYGDLGCKGNPYISTPNLDALARESVDFTNFYVSPLCSPSRASLLTGRYNYRTGLASVRYGLNLIHRDEYTLAEAFLDNGYRTGIFGKWHLGDNYPVRPHDMGFQEAHVHKGGYLGCTADPPGNSYFDPLLQHNGQEEQYEGYCVDVFTRQAIAFMEKKLEQPFFLYLPINTPHVPLDVSEQYIRPYREMGLHETVARTYGMITNIDDNVGKILERLKELNLEENTIVIFLSDNGPYLGHGFWDGSTEPADPEPFRYNADLRGRKNDVYDGGIRVPAFIRWPAAFDPGTTDRLAAHIDILPTLADLCNLAFPDSIEIDGTSLASLCRGEGSPWPDRYYFVHHRNPTRLWSRFVVRSQKYKLVNGNRQAGTKEEVIESLELFDMEADPGEQENIASRHPGMVEEMLSEYEAWYRDVTSDRGGLRQIAIPVGTLYENPVVLTYWDLARLDSEDPVRRRGWKIEVTQAGNYQIRLDFERISEPGQVILQYLDLDRKIDLEAGSESGIIDLQLEPSDGYLHTWIKVRDELQSMDYATITFNN